MEITNLNINGMRYPIGIDDPSPKIYFTAENEDGSSIEEISSYQLIVKKGRKKVWDTGKLPYTGENPITYAGPAPEAKSGYDLDLTLWDKEDQAAITYRPLYFETGFMGSSWSAEWIGPADGQKTRAAVQFRKTFTLEKEIKSARIYATAHGFYEMECNHETFSQKRLTPGRSKDGKSLYYQTCLATGIVRKGDNCLTLTAVGEEGREPEILVQLEITYSDGSAEVIGSGSDWECRDSYIIRAGNKGETLDLGKKALMEKSDSDDKFPWQPAAAIKETDENLVGQPDDGIRIRETIPARGLIDNGKKESIIDFGRMAKGFCHIEVRGKSGQIMKLEYAKELDAEGNFPDTGSKDYDQVMIYADEYLAYEPRFTLRAFRYVRVTGIEENQLADAIVSAM